MKIKIKNKKILYFSAIILTIVFIILILWLKKESKKNIQNTLIISCSTNIAGLDPGVKGHTHDVNVDRLFNTFHETLIETDIKGNVVPKIAESYVRKDKVITFKLRDDVYFHNGNKLKANDIKFSFLRAKDKKHDEYENIEKIEVIDDKTVELTLQNISNFLYEPIARYRIINQEAVEKNEKEGLKIGAGPYMLTKLSNEKIELKLFDNYYNKKRISNSIENITFKIQEDQDTALMELEQGDIDCIFDWKIDKLQNAEKLNKINIVKNSSAKCTYLFMNSSKTQEKIRKLIACSLDIPEIIKQLELKVEQLSTYVPKESKGHNETIKYHRTELNDENRNNIRKEVSNLSEEEKKLILAISPKESKEVGQKIQEQLNNVGFTVTLDQPDWNSFKAQTKNGEGKFNMSISSDMHEMPYGHKSILDYFDFQKENSMTHIDHDSNMKKLLEESTKDININDYEKKIKEVQQIMHDKVYVVPLYKQNAYFLTTSKIKDFKCDYFFRTDLTKVRKE